MTLRLETMTMMINITCLIFLLFHPLLIQPHESVVLFPAARMGAHDLFFSNSPSGDPSALE